MQRVDPHIAGEEEVEAAEPQELAAVAGHGSLQEAQGALTEHAHCDCSRRSPTSPPPPGPSLEPMNPSSLISGVAAFSPAACLPSDANRLAGQAASPTSVESLCEQVVERGQKPEPPCSSAPLCPSGGFTPPQIRHQQACFTESKLQHYAHIPLK